MSSIIDKIHSKGYWRVLIRPTIFNKDKIPTLTKCREIIEEAVVLFRGWAYPHFDNSKIINGLDYIEMPVEFMYHKEFWKFFQSGQFIHHFACQEDYYITDEYLEKTYIGEPSPTGRYLSIFSTLYTITEIFQFAARLSSKDILQPSVDISIGLHNMEDRKLFFTERGRHLSKSYICKIPEIIFHDIYHSEEVITNAAELAMEATIMVFERFNWAHHSSIIFPEEQRKLLEKRL